MRRRRTKKPDFAETAIYGSLGFGILYLFAPKGVKILIVSVIVLCLVGGILYLYFQIRRRRNLPTRQQYDEALKNVTSQQQEVVLKKTFGTNANHEARYANQNTDAYDLGELEWHGWEQLVKCWAEINGGKAYLTAFGPDKGVDVWFEKESSRLPIQVKALDKPVGVKGIREMGGILQREQLMHGIYVSKNGFTEEAKFEAKQIGLTLVSGEELLNELKELPTESQKRIQLVVFSSDWQTPHCSMHGMKMVEAVNRTTKEKFWRCPKYGCRHTLSKSQSNPIYWTKAR